MRFDKETRAKIQEAAPGSATIKWPTGAGQPEKGRPYRMQALEDVEKTERRLEHSPPTCADVMAQMHRKRYGKWPDGYKSPKPKLRRPTKEDPCILVLEVSALDRGYEATVALFEDPDPTRHTGLKAKVPAGPHPLFGHQEKVETEAEQIITVRSRSEREDAEDALKIEHEASVDHSKIATAERKLSNERRRGKSGIQAARALERARKRAELAGMIVGERL
jgi:hypothetical protein